MKLSVRWRLAGLATALGLMAIAITFLSAQLHWRSEEVRGRLREVDSESFHIADKFVDSLRKLNERVYSMGGSQVPREAGPFLEASRVLDQWMELQKPNLGTESERAALRDLEAEFREYRHAADDLLTRLRGMGEKTAGMDDYAPLRKHSQRLMDLGQALGRAHLASKDQILAQAGEAFDHLGHLVLASLALLLAFALALAAAVYRDMIVPLRRKLVESESLRERQEKLASLGVLAAGVAHEIRNPLTAIKGAMFLQRKRWSPGTPEASDADLIDREILRLERVVNDFLLFSRPGESKLTPIATAVLMRDVQLLLAPDLARSAIELCCEDAPTLRVLADEEQLKQVLINLVRNAAEAIDQEGRILLRARFARRRLAGKDSDAVILQVEDNGKGMSSEVQKRLFDPFFTTKTTGTGLGLSIAARIVQSHGGVLEYQTTPGHGTTFGVVLPAVVAPAARP